MPEISNFLIAHGGLVLFLMVLIEQAGVPIPAAPWLLASGALISTGKLSLAPCLGLVALACAISDGIWFYVGRKLGTKALRFLCKISIEPDSCVRNAQNVFTRFGMRGVLIAKFVPGVSLVVPALAGSFGVKAWKFMLVDLLGSLLYGGCFILIGVLFGNQLEQVLAALSGLGNSAITVVAGLIVAYIGYKFYQRKRLVKELAMSRITVDELFQRMQSGESLVILDVRSSMELEQDPTVIPGALHLSMDEMETRHGEIPRDREVVLYCSCPNEVSSARVAMRVRQRGVKKVRPLLGGIDEWRARNYPTTQKFVLVETGAPELGTAKAG